MMSRNIKEWRPSRFGLTALRYATTWELRVLPLVVGGEDPHMRSVPGGMSGASCDPEQIRRWWTAAPKANVGIACAASKLVVLNVDPLLGGTETLARLTALFGELPTTWSARTSSGAMHYYFRDPCRCDELHALGPGVDVRHHGYVVAPPSEVLGASRCVWIHPPWHARLCPLPLGLYARIVGRLSRAPSNASMRATRFLAWPSKPRVGSASSVDREGALCAAHGKSVIPRQEAPST
jgi:hypothetical protein